MKGVDVVFWFGVVAPAGTPNDVVKKLNTELAATINDPGTKERFLREGMEVTAGPPEELAETIASGATQWQSVVNSLGLKQQ